MFNFDYNSGYTNEQLQSLDRMRRKQGQQWMQTGVIPGGLEEARRGGIEAPAPPQIRPMYANPQSSGMGPVAPEYTRAEQEAQAANQIFDGGGRRVPEYVYGSDKPDGEIVPAPMDKWAEYNRGMAASGGEQGIFMQVGDKPAEFIPQKRNPQYEAARQQQQEATIAQIQAKQRPINFGDTAVRGAQVAGNMLTARDAGEMTPEQKAFLMQMLETNLKAASGVAPSGGEAPAEEQLPAHLQAARGGAVAQPTPIPQRPNWNQPQGQQMAPIVIGEQDGERLVKMPDGSYSVTNDEGVTQPVSPAKARSIAASLGVPFS